MTPLPITRGWIIIPAHLGLVLRWDSPRTRATASHAPFALALRPVALWN